MSLSSKCRIGALGPEGSYSEKAALLWSKGRPEATLVYFNDFEGVLEAVQAGRLEAGIVPVENSLEGAVTVVMDLLLAPGCCDCGGGERSHQTLPGGPG